MIVRKIRSGQATEEDLKILQELGEHIGQTSLCGLGKSATNHLLTSLKHFRHDFEERLR